MSNKNLIGSRAIPVMMLIASAAMGCSTSTPTLAAMAYVSADAAIGH